jgi:hypothetical protein
MRLTSCAKLRSMTLVLRKEASRQGKQPEEIALEALQQDFLPKNLAKRDLSFLIGSWSDEEYAEFQRNTEAFTRIDKETER